MCADSNIKHRNSEIRLQISPIYAEFRCQTHQNHRYGIAYTNIIMFVSWLIKNTGCAINIQYII